MKHAFEEAIADAHGDSVDEADVASRFERLVLPSLRLAQRIGSMHTSAAYVNLCFLLLHASPAVGTRIGVFSYGSGAACSMYHLRMRGAVLADTSVLARLDARAYLSADKSGAVVERYVHTYGRFSWVPSVVGAPMAPGYRIKAVDVKGRREYEHLAALDGPTDATTPLLISLGTPTQVDPPSVSRHVGIHALEVCTPRQCVSAAELERAHNIVGKYTEGLMMREFAACDEDENVVTMALTVLSRLVETHGLRYKDIGMVQVGSESLLDRSKSIKTHPMRLFDASANHGVEGVDNYQACYGGTAALFACTNWVESEAYDGRWAIAVTTDTAEGTKQYPFLNGAAAVAMLVGPDASLALEGRRVTHMVHEWDFYKPVGWQSMHPLMDGPHSMQVYFSCLKACQAKMTAAGGGVWVGTRTTTSSSIWAAARMEGGHRRRAWRLGGRG